MYQWAVQSYLAPCLRLGGGVEKGVEIPLGFILWMSPDTIRSKSSVQAKAGSPQDELRGVRLGGRTLMCRAVRQPPGAV